MTTQDTHSDSTTATSPDAAQPLKPGRWVVDPLHSSVVFSVRHLGLSKVRGRFDKFDASLDVGTSLDDTRVEATVEMASVDTNQDDRDEHLRSAEFFDVAGYPEMRFSSTRITGAGDDWHMEGELTVLGKTHPFEFDVELYGLQDFGSAMAAEGIPADDGEESEQNPTDNRLRAGFGATGELKRSKFGLDFGMPNAKGILLGDAVKFELDLQFLEPS